MSKHYLFWNNQYTFLDDNTSYPLNMANKGGYIKVPPSTPLGANKAYAWKIDHWETIDDYSDVTYYNRSKNNQEIKLKPGVIPDSSWKTTIIPLTTQEFIDFKLKTLQQLKDEKCEAIDSNTDKIIANGFTFDSNVFSLSIPAQLTWTGLKAYIESYPVTYPLPISTSDNKEYLLAQAKVSSFFASIFNSISGPINTGRALKLKAQAVTTAAGLDAVVDSRS